MELDVRLLLRKYNSHNFFCYRIPVVTAWLTNQLEDQSNRQQQQRQKTHFSGEALSHEPPTPPLPPFAFSQSRRETENHKLLTIADAIIVGC